MPPSGVRAPGARAFGASGELLWRHERRYTAVYELVALIVHAVVAQQGLPTVPPSPRGVRRVARYHAPGPEPIAADQRMSG